MVRSSLRAALLTIAAVGVLSLTLAPSSSASAATVIDDPVALGTAAPFAVLASSTVTNTGASVIGGNVGLSPGTSITGMRSAVVNGTVHANDAVAAQAQVDLTTAYGVAAGLSPTAVGFEDLTGQSLTPGVYAGGALSLSGALTLAGTARSVWVFQAASTLTIGSSAVITVTGGASACNVFWQVGSSATLNPGARFAGTIMANETITAGTAATVTGRLLARTGAVTLDTNAITAPTGCPTTPDDEDASPEITSAAPSGGTAGTDYRHVITANGSPAPVFTITIGSLPPGLSLDADTGEVTGMPTTPGDYPFTVSAGNGTDPDATATYTITITAALTTPEQGTDDGAGADPAPGTDDGAGADPAAGTDDGAGAAPAAGVLPVTRPGTQRAPSGSLAATGVDVVPALLLGLGAIGIGAMLATRRRNSPQHTR